MNALKVALVAGVTAALGCGHSGGDRKTDPLVAQQGSYGEATEMPRWVSGMQLGDQKLCGVGVAGAGYDEHSPYPKELSEERAVRNLAGVFGTRVQEAFSERETQSGRDIRQARVITVDEELIEKVANMVDTTYWLDVNGEGPYAAKNYTYAHACVDVKTAAKAFGVDADGLADPDENEATTPDTVPTWTKLDGRQPGGKLCAVGFSLPMFHADKTFQAVVEDIRASLAKTLQSFVSGYTSTVDTDVGIRSYEMMTTAITDAISKGAVVTHYWYDRDGIGPYDKARSTYGWGCVYPVDIITSTARVVEEKAPEEERKVIAKVRERARDAFADLDAEIEKRDN